MIRAVILLGALFWGERALALEYFGRFTTGGYVAQETLEEAIDGSNRNDFATVSSRLAARARLLSFRNLDLSVDLRDKHDVFDKLDRERLTLNGNNTFQLRELALRSNPPESKLFGTLGRFSVVRAGGVFTDGAEAGYALTPSWSVALFGGLNPKPIDQTYVTVRTDALVYGSYLLFESKTIDQTPYYYLATSLVDQRMGGVSDRLYWFHNFVGQPTNSTRIVSFSYFDLLKEFRLQNGRVNVSQDLTEWCRGDVGISAVDAIEYSRRASVLERLPSSAYYEVRARGRFKADAHVSLFALTSQGVRLADHLPRREYAIGSLFSGFPGLLHDDINSNIALGYRDNFTSRDWFLRAGIGYYPKKWEFSLSADLAQARYFDGSVLVPIVIEGSAARSLTRALIVTGSIQEAFDSKARIFSAFFKFSYRFGSEDVPPLRDGAPAMQGEI